MLQLQMVSRPDQIRPPKSNKTTLASAVQSTASRPIYNHPITEQHGHFDEVALNMEHIIGSHADHLSNVGKEINV